MKRALDEFVIEGIKTTIPFHRQLMDDPDYIAGNYTTNFMEDFVIQEDRHNLALKKRYDYSYLFFYIYFYHYWMFIIVENMKDKRLKLMALTN